jgi:hypothetical protein
MNTKSKKLNKSVQAVLALGLLGSAGTAAAADAACVNAAIVCAGEGRGVQIACAAAAIELEANPLADAACGLAIFTGVFACTTMFNECDKSAKSPRVVSGGTMGRTVGGPAFQWQCPSGNWKGGDKINRALGVQTRIGKIGSAGKTYVTSARMLCADGTMHTFVGNPGLDGAPDSSIWRGRNCGRGQMLQGLQAKDSNGITAIGGVCDPVGKFSVGDKDNVFVGLAPTGSLGVAGTGTCKEGSYLSGLKVWYNKSATLGQRYLQGMELICKTYK